MPLVNHTVHLAVPSRVASRDAAHRVAEGGEMSLVWLSSFVHAAAVAAINVIWTSGDTSGYLTIQREHNAAPHKGKHDAGAFVAPAEEARYDV